MRDRKRAADGRKWRRWKVGQEETVAAVNARDKKRARYTEHWTGFKHCLVQLQLTLLAL